MMTRSSLRVQPLRANSCTAVGRRLEMSTSMPSVNGMPCDAALHGMGLNILQNWSLLCSYELNLAAKDSPIKIIRHYHPPILTESQTDTTLKVRASSASQCHAVCMHEGHLDGFMACNIL